tara:strand:+ start:393 stop:659 length:267 start_codon:yes stop_codon:yes gene_type:complete
MMTYLVIGLCLLLLIAVIIISAKPIGMGIEARRNIPKDNNFDNEIEKDISLDDKSKSISDEITKLNKLRTDGIISEEEFEKAKEKIFN